jgi:hypothetical protein
MSEGTKKYRVREGFVLHPVDGREPIEGPAEVNLTEAEAVLYAAQIELADPAMIKAALAAEAAKAKAIAEAVK